MSQGKKTNEKSRRIAFYGDSLTEGVPGVSYFNMLKDKLPDDFLFNFGKGGDTVISLLNRIRKMNQNDEFDIAFVWVGVNDIFVKLSSFYPKLKTLMGQPWTENEIEFKENYKLILNHVCKRAEKVITVSPLCIGEDLENVWNKDLKKLSGIIREESSVKENVNYVDLHDYFQFPNQVSGYIPESAYRVLLDVMLLKTAEKVDRRSAGRGLLYTLDGIHLNSRGAAKIADIFHSQIINISY